MCSYFPNHVSVRALDPASSWSVASPSWLSGCRAWLDLVGERGHQHQVRPWCLLLRREPFHLYIHARKLQPEGPSTKNQRIKYAVLKPTKSLIANNPFPRPRTQRTTESSFPPPPLEKVTTAGETGNGLPWIEPLALIRAAAESLRLLFHRKLAPPGRVGEEAPPAVVGRRRRSPLMAVRRGASGGVLVARHRGVPRAGVEGTAASRSKRQRRIVEAARRRRRLLEGFHSQILESDSRETEIRI